MLIDSHLHLDFDEFATDRDEVMARAAAAGVDAYVCIGIRVRDFGRVRAVAETYDNVWCTVGTLPHFADEEHDVTAAEIAAHTRHPKVIGIGEAGLDTFYGNASWDAQVAVFQAHIDAARETQLPLVIHSVRQDAAMIDMLRSGMSKGRFRFVVHAFSGGPELAKTALELGGYLGFGGLLTYPDNHAMREIAASAPADRLLLETDSPSLAPVPYQDERNEPAHIVRTAQLLAELRGVTADELARTTSDNFYRLFAKARL
ncbi:LuxR family transcriptional regulator [Kaistia algarum]|uniref:TatD family hydrolase n=1 Tax=Kaistia algarum TaxID=2083279 RepID=UPI000CE82E5D|nr:TatD family hydrolase [Kaistia algarum]MCX5514019.1 TatD family hydrolase [Kaistia algarum]PPE77810.1 LuxR family transcriptional regulator [Kaistia algarum]